MAATVVEVPELSLVPQAPARTATHANILPNFFIPASVPQD